MDRIFGPTRTTLNPNDTLGHGAGLWEGRPFPDGESYPITSGFLEWEQFRKDLGLGPHGGVDVAAPRGTPLRAPFDGVITRSTFTNTGCGEQIRIIGAFGVEVQFCHMVQGSVPLRPGTLVYRGGVVGQVGSTGTSTGPHVHIAIRDNRFLPEENPSWTTDNPLAYISDDDSELDRGRVFTFRRVERGDTLNVIIGGVNALEGTSFRLSEIVEFNGIANPDRIRAGMYILFPMPNAPTPDPVPDDEEDTVNDGDYAAGRVSAAQDVLVALNLGDVRITAADVTEDDESPTPPAPPTPPDPAPEPEPVERADVEELVLQFRRGSTQRNEVRIGDIALLTFFGGVPVTFSVVGGFDTPNLTPQDQIVVDFTNDDTSAIEKGNIKPDSRGVFKIGTLTPPRIGSTGLIKFSLRYPDWTEDVFEIPYQCVDQRDDRFNLNVTPAAQQDSVYVTLR